MIEKLVALVPSPSPAPEVVFLGMDRFTLVVGSVIIAAIGGWALYHSLRRGGSDGS